MRKGTERKNSQITEYAEPTKGAGGKTGLWRTFKPVITNEKCKKCMLCWQYCPEAAISKGKGDLPEIDFSYCKGCGICARECKSKAIEMKRESE
ncbi:MAG: 4Fe-4S binding protein [Candidatus Atabeyarchaeum deiterrae]|jgi:pyruvate ferredoxin oxidoreductase delta subunit